MQPKHLGWGFCPYLIRRMVIVLLLTRPITLNNPHCRIFGRFPRWLIPFRPHINSIRLKRQPRHDRLVRIIVVVCFTFHTWYDRLVRIIVVVCFTHDAMLILVISASLYEKSYLSLPFRFTHSLLLFMYEVFYSNCPMGSFRKSFFPPNTKKNDGGEGGMMFFAGFGETKSLCGYGKLRYSYVMLFSQRAIQMHFLLAAGCVITSK